MLPRLSVYSNFALERPEGLENYAEWFLVSLILYVLWYILWYMWDNNTKLRYWWLIFMLPLYFVTLYEVFQLLGIEIVQALKWQYLARMVLISFIFLAIQSALKAQQNIAHLQLEKEQMQTENYKAQLKAIRAKIDPHFLFNSLNTLRSMVRQQHTNSEQFIMSLSDFYRQTLKHDENTTLRLSDELAVLQSFLFVMKSRNEEAVIVSIEIDQALYEHHLPTLALQIVVENCFKHNSMTSKSPLHIALTNTDDFYIQVTNNIQPKIGDQEPSGLGLDLLRKRYELLKIQNGVQIEHTETHFTAKIKLV